MTTDAKTVTPVSWNSSATVDGIWAAAATAFRINGEKYIKEAVYHYDDNGALNKVHDRNTVICLRLLENNNAEVTDEDRAMAADCRAWISNDLLIRTLKGRVGDFDEAVKKVLALKDSDALKNRSYNCSVICSLFGMWKRGCEREAVESRMRETSGNYVAAIGAKIKASVEVIRSVYSKTWSTWYITTVDVENRAMFFSYKSELKFGSQLTVAGTVKAHRDGSTQLTRVRITEEIR